MRPWSETFVDCGKQVGETFRITSKVAELIREVGVEDVQEKWYKVPIGPWSKDAIHINRPSDL